MPVPNLIHPVPVTLELIDTTETFYDDDTKEPLPSVKRDPVSLKAQVKYFDEDKLAVRDFPSRSSSGYLLFRQLDLDNKGVTIEQGVKIIKIGKRVSEFYVTGLKPMGHYTDRGGNTLLRADFADRNQIQ